MRQSLVWLILAAISSPSFAKSRTLTIGVASSRSFDTDLPDLRFAEKDLDRFVQAIKEVGNATDVMALKNPSIEQFRSAFGRVQSRSDDRIIFYFSGHSDASGLHLVDGRLSRGELHALLKSLAGETKIVFLDGCYSGALAAKGVKPAAEFQIPKLQLDEPSGTVFLAATGEGEAAYEIDALGGSLFTHYLVSGLYGRADTGRDGLVTIDELYQFIYREVRLHSVSLPGTVKQQPEYAVDIKGKGALVISYPKQFTERVTIAGDVAGEISLTAENSLQLHRIEKAFGQPIDIALVPGIYQIRVREPAKLGVGSIAVIRGTPAIVAKSMLRYEDTGLGLLVAKGKEDQTQFGVTASWHGGIPQYSNRGAMLGIHVTSQAKRVHFFAARLQATIEAQHHFLDNSTAKSTAVALLGGGTLAYYVQDTPVDGLAVQAGLFGGYGYLSQPSDADRGYDPVVQLTGFSLATLLPSKAGLLWTVEFRREFFAVAKKTGNETVAWAGNALGIGILF